MIKMKVLINKTETEDHVSFKFKDFEVNEFLTEKDPEEIIKHLKEDLTIVFSKKRKTILIADEIEYSTLDFSLNLEKYNVHYLEYRGRMDNDEYKVILFRHINWEEEFEGKPETEIPLTLEGRACLVCPKTRELLHSEDFKLHLERKEDFEKRHGVKV